MAQWRNRVAKRKCIAVVESLVLLILPMQFCYSLVGLIVTSTVSVLSNTFLSSCTSIVQPETTDSIVDSFKMFRDFKLSS